MLLTRTFSGGPPPADPPIDVDVDPTVAAWAAAPSTAPPTVELLVNLRRHSWRTGDIGSVIDIAVLDGSVTTNADADSLRAATRATWEADGLAAISAFTSSLSTTSHVILDEEPFSGTITMELNPFELGTLLAHPDLAGVWEDKPIANNSEGWGLLVPRPGATPSGAPSIDGREQEDILQSHQFYEEGFSGFRAGEAVALVENGADNMFVTHPAFEDGSGVRRLGNMMWSGGGFTSPTPSLPVSGDSGHASAVAGQLFGDLLLGQDPAVVCGGSNFDCHTRSGVARGALGRGFDLFRKRSKVMKRLLTSDLRFPIINHSAGDVDNVCDGKNANSRVVNTLFENGVAWFNSAGNGGDSATECRVGVPGDALGAFTVGASNMETDVSSPAHNSLVIRTNSSVGGGNLLARGRTVVDIVSAGENGPSAGAHVATPYPGIRDTSAAAPTVSGVAALFREHYLDEVGTLVDEKPGILYANMLLMGDRRSASGYKMSSGYDRRWGAGQLRARMINSVGLDAPAYWITGHFCLDHNEERVIPLNREVVAPADMNTIRATAYFYDPRFDDRSSASVPEIEMAIVKFDSGSSTWIDRAVDNSGDNKLRAHIGSVGVHQYGLRFKANSVSSDETRCGDDSMLVYFASLMEDNDRDDPTLISTDPTWVGGTGNGGMVRPE